MNKNFRYGIIFFILLLINIFFSSVGNSQTKLEAGPLLGISWYNGDLNPQRQFYRIHPSAGIILRYSLNDRIAFRAGASVARISGAYPLTGVVIKENGSLPYKFSRNVGDFSTMIEINFFSFDHPFNKKSDFTPFVTFGLGSVFYKRYLPENGNHSEKPLFVLSLPFGGGVKWKVSDRLRLGLEWTYRKTFADDLDVVGTGNPVDASNPFGFDKTTSVHNNDWISVVGVSAAFSIISSRNKCHAGF